MFQKPKGYKNVTTKLMSDFISYFLRTIFLEHTEAYFTTKSFGQIFSFEGKKKTLSKVRRKKM